MDQIKVDWKDYRPNFFNQLNTLRSDDILTDVVVTCGGSVGGPRETFPAHSLILSASSLYFRDILGGRRGGSGRQDWRGSHGSAPSISVVHIACAEPSTVHALLEFLYSGSVLVPASEVETLFQLARELRVHGLSVTPPPSSPSPASSASSPDIDTEQLICGEKLAGNPPPQTAAAQHVAESRTSNSSLHLTPVRSHQQGHSSVRLVGHGNNNSSSSRSMKIRPMDEGVDEDYECFAEVEDGGGNGEDEEEDYEKIVGDVEEEDGESVTGLLEPRISMYEGGSSSRGSSRGMHGGHFVAQIKSEPRDNEKGLLSGNIYQGLSKGHVKSPSTTTQVSCEICSRLFRNRKNLKDHLRRFPECGLQIQNYPSMKRLFPKKFTIRSRRKKDIHQQ